MASKNALIEKIENGIQNLTTLTITTAVGPVTVDENNNIIPAYENAKVMHSEIDLVQGDIRTIYDNVFFTED